MLGLGQIGAVRCVHFVLFSTKPHIIPRLKAAVMTQRSPICDNTGLGAATVANRQDPHLAHMTDIASASTDAHRMTPLERRATFSLSSIYGVRMLGLFMVMPVFALEARRYIGGEDPSAVGLAMGVYGLVQAALAAEAAAIRPSR